MSNACWDNMYLAPFFYIRAVRLQVQQAKRWHERHPACFLPLAWAVTAALAAKWEQCGGGRKEGDETTITAKRPSPFSVLALTAAFLDKVGGVNGVLRLVRSSCVVFSRFGATALLCGVTAPPPLQMFLRSAETPLWCVLPLSSIQEQRTLSK